MCGIKKRCELKFSNLGKLGSNLADVECSLYITFANELQLTSQLTSICESLELRQPANVVLVAARLHVCKNLVDNVVASVTQLQPVTMFDTQNQGKGYEPA